MYRELVRNQYNRIQELVSLFNRKRLIEEKYATGRTPADLAEYRKIIDRLKTLL